MENLIGNSQLMPDSSGLPESFCGSGYTYDGFSVDGYRTLSVSLPSGPQKAAIFSYCPVITVRGKSFLYWGFIIRARKAGEITLISKFYDSDHNLNACSKQKIEGRISRHFTREMARFPIPDRAEYAHLSMDLKGRISVCKFYAPAAYFGC